MGRKNRFLTVAARQEGLRLGRRGRRLGRGLTALQSAERDMTTTTGYLKRASQRCREIRDRLYPLHDRPYYVFTNAVKALARPDGVVVDAGCGRDASWLRRISPFFGKAVGFDYEIARPAAEGHCWVLRGDAHRIPLASGSVDVIGTISTLEHFADPARVFEEFRRVLRPDGALFVLTVNQYFPPIILGRIFPHRWRQIINSKATHSEPEDTFPAFYRANTRRALERFGERAGFEVRSVRYLNNHPDYFQFSPLLYRMWAALDQGPLRMKRLEWLRHFLLAEYRAIATEPRA